tara:strand:+ start:90 stop:734 length:645 start_codon:yes stop_codon:yes gene_type:complete
MKASSCPNCGAPFQFSTTKLACEFCGYSFDTKQSNTSNALNPNASEGGTSVSSDNLSLQDINFKSIRSKYHYESIIKIVLLTFLTCGLYYIYKLFNWTQILNQADVDEGSKVNPGSVIILSLISCGLVTIYYHYKIAKRSKDFAKKTKDYNNKIRKGIKKPVDNLPQIICLGWICTWIIVGLSDGEASFLITPFIIWSIIAVQRSVEYAVGIKR